MNIIIGQPQCPVVGRRPQHAVSKLACLALSSVRSSIQYLSRSSLRRLAGLPCGPSCHNKNGRSPSGHMRGSSIAFEAVDVPAQDQLIFLTLLIMNLFPLSHSDVFLLSLYLMTDVQHTCFHFSGSYVRPQVCYVHVW